MTLEEHNKTKFIDILLKNIYDVSDHISCSMQYFLQYNNSTRLLYGGGDLKEEKKINIIKYIKSTSIEDIQLNLEKMIKNNAYCNEIIGEGMMGVVYASNVGNRIDAVIGNKKVNIPIVIKKARDLGTFDMKIINNILYICTYKNITTEALILSYINDVYNKTKNPHLPFMIGYSACNNSTNLVDTIVTERHGLDKKIKIKITGFDVNPLLYPEPSYDGYFKTHMATLSDLLMYINFYRKGDVVKLLNNQTCNIVELLDYITISYMHTHNMLSNNGIILGDMHTGNIFIHWLHDDSYMDKIKYIVYKNNNKYIRIKTFGFILKIGDVGSSIVQPKKDIFILGQANDIEKYYNLIEQMIKPNYSCYPFLLSIFKYASIPNSISSKTIGYEILQSYPYNEIGNSETNKLINDMLTPNEILNKYSKYFVEKPIKTKDMVIVL
jgi:hypothetical protein